MLIANTTGIVEVAALAANVAVIAYTDAGFGWLREHLTAEVVAAYFAPLGATRVERFEAANVRGLNFMLYDALAGGASRAVRPRVDPQAGETLRRLRQVRDRRIAIRLHEQQILAGGADRDRWRAGSVENVEHGLGRFLVVILRGGFSCRERGQGQPATNAISTMSPACAAKMSPICRPQLSRLPTMAEGVRSPTGTWKIPPPPSAIHMRCGAATRTATHAAINGSYDLSASRACLFTSVNSTSNASRMTPI